MVIKDLDKLQGFRERLQDTRTEVMVIYEEFAAVLVKRVQCGCKCCTEGAHVHADLQVSHCSASDAAPSTDRCEGGV